EVGGGDETVVAAADDDRVVGRLHEAADSSLLNAEDAEGTKRTQRSILARSASSPFVLCDLCVERLRPGQEQPHRVVLRGAGAGLRRRAGTRVSEVDV